MHQHHEVDELPHFGVHLTLDGYGGARRGSPTLLPCRTL